MALILTTTAYAPLALLQGWLQDVARSQPGDPGGRSGPPGLRRQRHLGRHLARPARPRRPARRCSAPSPCARCAAPARDGDGRATPSDGPSARWPSGCCAQNWLEGERDGTRASPTPQPSPGRYPWQWYWDSCFAAIVWRRFEPARARAELESLLAAQRDDGFIGHTIFWDRPGLADPLLFYNVASRGAFQTETIQPPLLAWAWRIAVGDPAAGAADRRPDGLARGQPRPRGRRPALDRAARRVRPRRLAEVRTGLGLARERRASASRCWSAATAGSASTRGGSATAATRCSARRWSTRSGRSRCRRWDGPRRRRPWSSGSGTSAAALFLDEVAAGRRAARRPHLGRPGAAGAARPAGGDRPAPGRGAPAEPSASSSPRSRRPRSPPREPSYEPDGGHGPIRRYWRGPTWVNSAWMVWLGMRRLGYEAEARAAGRRPDRRGRPRRPARVLRPPHGQGPGRQGLRLVSPDRRDGRTRTRARRRAICSGR